MTKPRPKTGEPRKADQPFRIDVLPQPVKDAIEVLRNRCTWEEIAERSAKPYSKDWEKDGGGFIDWESLDLAVLEKFPLMRLTKSGLQRWYDVRMKQVRSQVLRESAQAREFASAFVGKDLEGANGAVVNALRDQVFGLIQSARGGDKLLFADGLKDLTLAMTRIQRVDLQAQRVDVDRRKMALLEEREARARKAVDETTKEAARKGTGQFGLAEINLLRERTFGLPPLTVNANG